MNKSPIPIEANHDWWWYVAKRKLLKFLIDKKIKEKKFNHILEIGPGLGNNIQLLKSYGNVDVLETEQEFIKYLKKNLENQIDKFYYDLINIEKKFDLIVMLDVLEHIENSKEFMENLKKYVNSNGIIIIGVPAYMSLWSNHDKELKHYRRYTWNTLIRDCRDYKVIHRFGFNFLLLPIRFIQLKFSKRIHSTNETGNLLNKIFLIISNIEYFLRYVGLNPKFGISIYAIMQKKE